MLDSQTRRSLAVVAAMVVIGVGCASVGMMYSGAPQTAATAGALRVEQDERAGTISVYRAGGREPIVTQNARPDMRPYLHPIAAPDGRGVPLEPGDPAELLCSGTYPVGAYPE